MERHRRVCFQDSPKVVPVRDSISPLNFLYDSLPPAGLTGRSRCSPRVQLLRPVTSCVFNLLKLITGASREPPSGRWRTRLECNLGILQRLLYYRSASSLGSVTLQTVRAGRESSAAETSQSSSSAI